MSVSSFPYGINSWCRVQLEDVPGPYYEGDTSGPVSSTISFERDGTVDHIGSVGGTSKRGDWWSCAEDADIGDGFEIRGLSAGKVGTWTSAAAADDTWVALTSDRAWTITRNSGFGTSSVTQTFEIRRAGGPTLQSKSFTVSAEIII